MGMRGTGPMGDGWQGDRRMGDGPRDEGRMGAWGGPLDGRRGGDFFAMLDADKDGRVTLAEASALPLAMFDRADTNKDGTVTPEERRAARDAMWGHGRGRRG
jgi:hypothetical protein